MKIQWFIFIEGTTGDESESNNKFYEPIPVFHDSEGVKSMIRKFQVFISSTYEDLRDDRQAAISAILSAGHIPTGMEAFGLGQDMLDTIYRWIDECDIFLLILGGRYGSLDANTGKSYIHLEYEYAIKQNKPLFTVILEESELELRVKEHGTKLMELGEREKYGNFKDTVKKKLCGFYGNLDSLKAEILKQLNNIKNSHTLSGWVRFSDLDHGTDNSQRALIQRLQSENSTLRQQLIELGDKKKTALPMEDQLKRLKYFFDSKGVTGISYSQGEWSVFTASTPDSYGAPEHWANNPAIYIDEYEVVDGISRATGLRYAYCPRCSQGVKIIMHDGRFVIETLYE